MKRQKLSDITEIIIHTTDSPRRGDSAADVDRWHKERGFTMVGYHWIIGDGGDWQNGRPMFLQGAHCSAAGRNKNTIGIALFGKPGEEISATDEQLISGGRGIGYGLDELINYILKMCPNIKRIRSHSDYDGDKPYCPGWPVGEYVKKRWPWINKPG